MSGPPLADAADPNWWKTAVFYQVYPRSFADSTGNGVGDLRGITARLGYLEELGVDAIWLSPFYPSGGVDGGYDVTDYCDVDADFGNLEDFDNLLNRAHKAGIKVVIDLVPNHSSDRHPLFVQALASPPGSPARAIYHFHDGRGRTGDLPPNNWTSVFGGPSWTRETGDGQWYYHLFAPEQPDFNWENPAVLDYFEGVLRFWLDRGVDGFRIDVSDALIKDTTWPDTADGSPVIPKEQSSPVHDIYRHFRRILDEYPGTMAVLETGAEEETVALFLRPDEMHQAFNFRFLKSAWDAGQVAKGIEESLDAALSVGAPTTWVIENHDATRAVTRYASGDALVGDYVPVMQEGASSTSVPKKNEDELDGFNVGVLRARAMALLLLALPGSAYIYAGQELGLPEVLDLPDELRSDPGFLRSGGEILGRDGCRVPLPWSGVYPPFGFSLSEEAGVSGVFGTTIPTGLPQPEDWAALTVEAQESDPDSMLALYRRMLLLRLRLSALGGGHLQWVLTPEESAESGILHVRLVPPASLSAEHGLGPAPAEYELGPASAEHESGPASTEHESGPASTEHEIDVVVNFGPNAVSLPDGTVVISSGPASLRDSKEYGALLSDAALLPGAAPSSNTTLLPNTAVLLSRR